MEVEGSDWLVARGSTACGIGGVRDRVDKGRSRMADVGEREGDTVGGIGEGRSIWKLLLLNVNLLYQGIEIPPGISFGCSTDIFGKPQSG